MSQQHYEVTLSTGKVLTVREMTIKLKNQCVAAVSHRLGKDGAGPIFSSELQDEMTRVLILTIDGKTPSGVEREDLDQLLTFGEYNELNTAVAIMMGADDSDVKKKPKIQLVITGS